MRSDLGTARSGRKTTDGVNRGTATDRFGMASADEASHLLAADHGRTTKDDVAHALTLMQGGYYLLAGVWPLVHMRSFEMVTGKKTDRWLVRTVGALAASIGYGLLSAGRRGRLPVDLRNVSLLAAAGFVAVEVPTALRGRISPIYLADAVVELGFIGAALWARQGRDDRGQKLDELARQEAQRMNVPAPAARSS